ncbi:methyltransferase-like protein 17, mitochondrial isoform X4 [Brienomyrus brachyistius]|uniref:methyltransferase-like protein 17, mitochondrial isoform X4 n=1 Tax=Brienomyrus brachyistius TaxID=42636 RepID=UPI0020B2A2DC|nr:methyltransferase-like protein 17, mitochondrial isoform X4 [Brienomyrus brachyistius]
MAALWNLGNSISQQSVLVTASIQYLSMIPLRTTYKQGYSTVANVQALAGFLKGAPHRKHPGVTALKTVHLPEELQKGALSIVHGAALRDLTEQARRLSNFLWSRKRPVDEEKLRERALAMEKALWEQEMESRADTDSHLAEMHIRKKVLSALKKTTYHWTPLRYDDELCVVYLAARLAAGYAAVRRALNEIKKRDPTFSPFSLLDFGSGLGTVVWAARTTWGDSLKESVCVDSSKAMNTLAERLLRGGSDKEDPLIKQVYFRQFLPVSPKVQFDLVTSAFGLSELPSKQERTETVLTLWRKTHSYLVLVENGTKEGHQILMEARDTVLKVGDTRTLTDAHTQRRDTVLKVGDTHTLTDAHTQRRDTVLKVGDTRTLTDKHTQRRDTVLKVGDTRTLTDKHTQRRDTVLKGEEKATDRRRPLVFAPCAHQLPCPKLAQQPQVPCNYPQPFCPLPLPENREHEVERFSYLVMTRQEPEVENAGPEWARLTGPVLRRPRHVHCQLCCADGELRRVVVTPSRHGRDVYRCARNSDYGDRLPIMKPEVETIAE